MRRYVRKCRGVGELALMEVSQVVGVRTRARALALAAAEADGAGTKRKKMAVPRELHISYLQLRSRRLVMPHPISTSPVNSTTTPRHSPERGQISRCSSNASCDMMEHDEQSSLRSVKSGDDLEAAACYFGCSRERRETTPSSNKLDQFVDLESTAEKNARRSASPTAMPTDAEIEDFFAAAERTEKRRFADKYNFDVDKDVPLEGRYEWVRLSA